MSVFLKLSLPYAYEISQLYEKTFLWTLKFCTQKQSRASKSSLIQRSPQILCNIIIAIHLFKKNRHYERKLAFNDVISLNWNMLGRAQLKFVLQLNPELYYSRGLGISYLLMSKYQ